MVLSPLYRRLQHTFSLSRFCPFSTLFLLLLLFSLTMSAASKMECKRVGAEELIDEVGCELMIVRVNRCSGYCFSATYPSLRTGRIAGISKCCRMTDSEFIHADLSCVEGPRAIRIPSAVQCECFDCPIS